MTLSAPAGVTDGRRVRVRVEGVVQGVGFRPYVHRLASGLGLGGHVLNDAAGVVIELEGADGAVEAFLERLGPDAPPLAVIERVAWMPIAPVGEAAFRIEASRGGEPARAPVAADSATCADCLAELLDPGDRRHRYPFINCTNCGPRFTIVRGIPYDRPFTTMAGFTMCPACRREYEDPSDRRFHAQPNACPVCGPSLRVCDHDGSPRALRAGEDAVALIARALRSGAVVAVKGLGGFHLACLASDEAAVATLRARKHREEKPFALMAGSPEQASALVRLGPAHRELLQSAARPIVLAPRRARAPVAAAVAPGCRELGVMLPYTPLHHLLLRDVGEALVLTSGNLSDEPIAFRDEDALGRLSGVADLFLLHDRPIETRTDDSVVRVLVDSGRTARRVFLRRSRGYVPTALALPAGGSSRPLLACGAELKNTFTVAKGTRAWVSHHIGDLENYETFRSFAAGVDHLCRLFEVSPAVVAHDLHPEYLSTKWAREREGVELVGVQHHHAHLAACLAEHGEAGPAVGAIFDGSGFGLDGTIWGGEILCGDLRSFQRVGALRSVRLPGGERAIREPWRMAVAWLREAGLDPGVLGAGASGRELAVIERLLATGIASPVSTSVGRLFDAVAALCGVRSRVSYEGQAAVELEGACAASERGAYPMPVVAGAESRMVIDPRETIRAVVSDVRAGVEAGRIAARFHRGLGLATVEACRRAASACGTELVVLSGGVFANLRLLSHAVSGLSEAGLRVLTPERLPPGDGGVSYGQAAIACARMTP